MINVNVNPKNQIISLLNQELGANPNSKQEKQERSQNISGTTLKTIQTVRQILAKNEDLNKDTEVFKSILKFSENNDNENVKTFRIEQCIKALTTFDKGIAKIKSREIDSITQSDMDSVIESVLKDKGIFDEALKSLAITESCLMNFKSQEFWNYIKYQEVDSLKILQTNGETITYGKTLLTQLSYDKKPDLATLTKQYTLEFKTGEIILPHAKLLCCGEWFESNLSGRFVNRKTENILDLHDVSFPSFLRVLHMVDPIPDSDEYKNTVIYLGFKPYRPPEIPGIYGATHWEKYWGDIGETPSIPDELLKAWNGPCPIFNKEKKADGPKMMDTHVAFYMPKTVDGKKLSAKMMEMISNSDKFGDNNIGFHATSDAIVNAIPEENEGGYWFAMLKPNEEFFKVLRSKRTDEQETYFKEYLPKEYQEFPSTIQALVYCLMPYAEKKVCMLGENTSTRCKDKIPAHGSVQSTTVGSMSARGVRIIPSQGDAKVGFVVVPMRKFPGS